MAEQAEDLVTVKEAAALLRRSPAAVYGYLDAGKLTSKRPGYTGKLRRGGVPHLIPRSEVLAFRDANPKPDEPKGGAT